MVCAIFLSLSCCFKVADYPSFAARDYVEGMWLMLQQPSAEDFVLATGEKHSVREFVEKSFTQLGIELK